MSVIEAYVGRRSRPPSFEELLIRENDGAPALAGVLEFSTLTGPAGAKVVCLILEY